MDKMTGKGASLLKPVLKDWKRCLLHQRSKHTGKATRVMDNKENILIAKE
jgi:hypothetical protein